MAKRFDLGDRVFVTTGVPTRYLDRSGVVVGTVPKGRGVQYLVSFPNRRVGTFRVSAADLRTARQTYGWTDRFVR